ncbi:LamG domain-containing protein [[Eubacterium] cellulosolvens]
MSWHRKITLISIIILLLINCTSFTLTTTNLEDNPNGNNLEIAVDLNEHPKNVIRSESRATQCSNNLGRPREQNNHGGCWLDSFVDDSWIDWTMSDTIKINNENIEIDNEVGNYSFIDTFSAPLNTNEWNNITGGGMTLFTHPFLRATKSGQAQTFNSYIETKRTWKGYRVIEWDWNSYYDSAWNSFGHAMIFYVNGTKNLVLGIPANRVMYVRNESFHLYDAPFAISANTWYNMKMILGPNNITFQVKNPIGSLIIDEVMVSNSFDINYSNSVTIHFASVSAATGFSFDTRVDNFKVYLKKRIRTGNITTKQINIPSNMRGDSLIINKAQPDRTYINITILDATDNQPIAGSPVYTENGEFDISYIDSKQYPSIKLNATFSGNNWVITPILHYWGVSWNASSAWKDSFFGGEKVESQLYLDVFDGKAQAMRNQTEFKVDGNTVALWHFNEGSGSTLNDETTNNNDGTINGASWTMGRFDRGLSFDGVNDYVDCGNKGSWNFGTSDFTIETWVKTSDTGDNPIVGRRQSNNMMDLRVEGVNNGKILFTAGMGGTYHNSRGKTSVNDGNWHYIVGVREYNKNLVIYVDGVDDTYTTSKDDDVININRELLIGARQGSITSIDAVFKGTIDEIRISNIARTPQEIKDHYLGSGFKTFSVLESKPISIPNGNYFDKLIINKSVPSGAYLNVTIFDTQSNTPIPDFNILDDTIIDLSSINPHIYPSIKLKATFESNGDDTPTLYDWSVNWTGNKPPQVLDITSSPIVNRTQILRVNINLSDHEDSEQNLTLKVEYKSPLDTTWQSSFLTDTFFNIDHWECVFTPPFNADLGLYSFNVSCNDSFQYFAHHLELDYIEVVNNKPTQPDVMIVPDEPKTYKDLNGIAWNSTDIETQDTSIKYWYYWYKNNTYTPEFDNLTTIPSSATAKGDIWRCVAYPFDGWDVGNPGYAEVTILNTPPELVEEFDYQMMVEDSSAVFENKLNSIFSDKDNDKLIFSAEGHKNITINIFQDNGTIEIIPKENWFGMEYITFYAKDTSSEQAQNILAVQVVPTNDLPKIVSVGNQLTSQGYPELEFIVNQNKWLNLTISVLDIDGDVKSGMIRYLLNITTKDNLFIDNNLLIFHPTNEDVGWNYIDIKVTDNNETPVINISQPIRILVLNVNDPPTVEIIGPEEGSEFSENEKFTLISTSDDPDFKILDYSEKHEFRWFTNITEIGDLGYGQQLINITLKHGHYTIYVEVTDLGNAKAYDSIEITIKEAPSAGGSESELLSNILIWIGLIIAIIIVILIIILFFIFSKKKKERLTALGIPEQEILEPDAVYQPGKQLPRVSSQAPLVMTQGAPQVTGGGTVQRTLQASAAQFSLEPTPQLPSGQRTETMVQEPTLVEEERAQIDSALTPQQKLELIEERFIRGEMDQDIYLNLKAKYELQTKQYEPAPQLPASASPQMPTPPPTPTVAQPQTQLLAQPQPLVQPQPQARPQVQPQPQVQSQAQPQTQPQLQPQAQPQAKPQVPPKPQDDE